MKGRKMEDSAFWIMMLLVGTFLGVAFLLMGSAEKVARPVAEAWLSKLASGEYREVLDLSTPPFRKQSPENNLSALNDRLALTVPIKFSVVRRTYGYGSPRDYGMRGYVSSQTGRVAIEIILEEVDGDDWKVRSLAFGKEIERRAGVGVNSSDPAFTTDIVGIDEPPLRKFD